MEPQCNCKKGDRAKSKGKIKQPVDPTNRYRLECRCPVHGAAPTPSPRRLTAIKTTGRSMTKKVQAFEPKTEDDGDGEIDDPILCMEVNRISGALDLMEFVAEVSLCLEDQGATLRRVMEDELAMYRTLVEDVFATWNRDVSDAAARNQRELQERYQQWTQRLKQRTKANNTWLSQFVPDFDWQRYYDDPHYVDQLFAVNVDGMMKEHEDVSQWRKQNFHKLYWLREQAKRATAENDRLSQDLDNSRRKNHDQQTLVNMNRELMHEKHAQLLFEVKELKEQRTRLSDVMGNLFMELEGINRTKLPQPRSRKHSGNKN